MRIYLDANVLFSAADPDSALGKSLRAVSSEHELVSSPLTLAETRTNIATKRSVWADGLESLLDSVAVVPDAELRADAHLVEKDRHVLGAAIASSCDLLVTGDRRHFGHLYDQVIDGVTVVSVSGLFERLNES